MNYTKCIVEGCEKPACRWDGGVCGVRIDAKLRKLMPGYVVWLCEVHDPDHNHFDLPENFEGAVGALVALRNELQEMFGRALAAEEELRILKEADK